MTNVLTSDIAETSVRSQDGTAIAYTRAGEGPALIVADGALCHRGLGPASKLAPLLTDSFTVYTYDRRGRGASGDTPPASPEREIEDLEAVLEAAGGSANVIGISSGAALAMETAKRSAAIEKLVLYEAPFVVDDTHAPLPDDFIPRMEAAITAGRPGDAVVQFLRWVGMPAPFVAVMKLTPMWRKLKAAGRTLPYDIALIAEHHRGRPLAADDWADVRVPALVAVGSKSPEWMRNGMAALAGALPDGRLVTLEGQTHMVKPKVLAPLLADFFSAP